MIDEMPGSEILSALEKDLIDAADYVGPAVNHALGFQNVAKYVSMGPPGFMSIYQPVDLMDLTVAMKSWLALSPRMRAFLEDLAVTDLQEITNSTIPEDYVNKRKNIHRCWRITV